MPRRSNAAMADPTESSYDVVVVGAGIGGINAGYRIQTQCPDLTYQIIENRSAMGGTWDLFRYPGIRSDSDLHTFGFPWRPWHENEAIAHGDLIRKYIKESAEENGIDKKIRFNHRLVGAEWSSDQQKWRLEIDVGADGAKKQKRYMNASFLLLGTGYYDYQQALPTSIPGLENFKGTTIHPQWWPEDLDYTGKRMVIIGSGATAVTLLPVLAETAKHVTMVQRSPGYLISLPKVDPMGSVMKKILPSWMADRLIRWKFLLLPFIFFHFCRTFPNAARTVMRRVTARELPRDFEMDPHFKPRYNPWEQRLCVCPDGDFFKALSSDKASVATGIIKTVTEDGILLDSGEKIDADIIITATGLKIQMAGGAKLKVDGKPYDFHEHYVWKGVMLQDLPNAATIIGYTNASWTLGADAAAQHVCRILNSMKANGQTSVVPRVDDETKVNETSVLNLNSTYVIRGRAELPKAGDTKPWKPRSNYFTDIWEAKWGNITNGLQFYRVST